MEDSSSASWKSAPSYGCLDAISGWNQRINICWYETPIEYVNGSFCPAARNYLIDIDPPLNGVFGGLR